MGTKQKKYGDIISSNKYFIKCLLDLGINNNYTGYFYLIFILDLLINEELVVKSFNKEIYPLVAIEFNKTTCTIERNIRNLIDKTWNNVNKKLKDFWRAETKPTCQKFIYMIKNYILMQIT